VPRKKRELRGQTHLSQFLLRLLKEKNLTLKAAAGIAGTAPSVVQGWKDGAMPSETVSNLKKLCNAYGYSLSFALTGEVDDAEGGHPLPHYIEDEWFDGYARIKIMKLVPKRKEKP
jgi:transcriptional regulator with XRE-family HTH domain